MELKTIGHGCSQVIKPWLQSGDQTMAPEDTAWQAMPHVCEVGCITNLNYDLYDLDYED